MAKHSLLRDFVFFVKHHKAYWLVPLISVLIVLGLIAVFAQSSPFAFLLYPLF